MKSESSVPGVQIHLNICRVNVDVGNDSHHCQLSHTAFSHLSGYQRRISPHQYHCEHHNETFNFSSYLKSRRDLESK